MKVELRGTKFYVKVIDNQTYLYRNIISYLRNRFDPITTVLYRLDNKED